MVEGKSVFQGHVVHVKKEDNCVPSGGYHVGESVGHRDDGKTGLNHIALTTVFVPQENLSPETVAFIHVLTI